MKAFTVLLLVLAQVVFASNSWAQSARQLTRRITGEGKPIQSPPPPPPRRAAPAAPAVSAAPAVPAAPVDPAKAAEAKAEQVKKTVEFQKKRAEQGSPSAQYDLGLRYAYGDGVEQDYELGKKWFGEAAKNGNKQAAAKLEEFKKWDEEQAKKKK
ncbi:MAG: sel1 repeat family protein [Verrucomicrobia bacterium]|nr:sel1 repeat family protein [Verrucomicrobiota bacterium]